MPALATAACLVAFVWLLIARPVPSQPRLFLEAAAAIGFVVGSLALASVVGGAALLEEQSDAEPLRFQEAGWILGLPLGVILALALVLPRPPTLEGSGLMVYALPLVIATAFTATLWAVVTRLVLRQKGLTRDDYACAATMAREQYAPLGRRKQAWRAARQPQKLTADEARTHLPDIVSALADQLDRARDEAGGKHIIELLGQLGEKTVGPELLAALQSKRPANRRAAAVALGKLSLPEAVPALARAATEDKNSAVRRAAVVAAGKLENPLALPALLSALEDRDMGVRQSACVALGKLGAVEALPGLEQALHDARPSVQTSAARAIAQISGAPPQVDVEKKAKS